ncbi:cytochrome c oxidase subunit 3 family protein [Dankookia rubra]|uniref:Cytochrome c oxidase subunit 3 family protein n=1 Tax=Dankookia rubra TaxID=1442381 RepID=A0A4V3A9X3_9PROT|nr:cytochrome c oxidase subunit 3 [Dankookia rubra]TDH60875.1 cytochrome c oxidase subunit 3 family protein [Dankookia rubra]
MSDIAARNAALRQPWRSLRRQREGAAFGIWIFLGSEVMFFGCALLTFAVYRSLWPDAFAAAARETNITYGTVNTALLLTSSLTMAAAAEGAAAGLRRLTLCCLAATVAFGIGFLVVKGFEYQEDITKHLVPGAGFRLEAPQAQIFFAFYWLLTGVHAVHLSTGIGIATVLGIQAWRGSRMLASPAFEALGLYWHFVDLVWVFLYPLLYLGGRS